MSARIRGTVRWFNEQKGYGFIGRDDGEPDVFVHATAFRNGANPHATLVEEEAVEFEIGADDRGRVRAQNILKLAETDR